MNKTLIVATATLQAIKAFVVRQIDKVLIPEDQYTSFEVASAQHRHAKAGSDEMTEIGDLLTGGQEGSALDSPLLRDAVNGTRRPSSREQHRN